jgi:uncharacterized Rmd1/YagE family protein
MIDMKNLNFICYKVALSLPLEKIAAFLKTQMTFSWKEYIELKDEQLDIILKTDSEDKSVYLFKYGCISFVNFSSNETYNFLKYIELIIGKIDYSLFYKYHESHVLEIDDDLCCSVSKEDNTKIKYTNDINHIIAIILAKSVEMFSFDTKLSELLGTAEKIIVFLQKGRLKWYRKKSCLIISKILRFEFDSIKSVRIFDRPVFAEHSIKSKEIFDSLMEYFEISDRFKILQNKINDLREITELYTSLSQNQSEYRLIMFEILLLLLFPLFYVIENMIQP